MRRFVLALAVLGLGCGDDSIPGGGGSSGGDESGSSTSDPSGGTVTASTTATSSSGGEPEPTASESTSASTSSSSSSSSDTSSDSGPAVEPPEVNDDLYRTLADATLEVSAAEGLFANDVDASALTLVEADAMTERGGTVDVDPDGAFTYAPPAGDWGPDRFEYTVMNEGGGTATATATINLMPTEIPLARIADGDNGYLIQGGNTDLNSSRAMSSAGDVDGDGIGDVLVGAPEWGASFEGRCYVAFGKDNLDAVDLGNVADGTGGILIQGAAADLAGSSVGAAGDVNGDGLADIVIGGAGTFLGDSGEVSGWVVFGKADTDPVTLSALDESGFEIVGVSSNANPGRPTMRVASVDDMNDDGLDEILVGFHEVPDTGFARSWVVFGKADASPIDLADVSAGVGGFVIEGAAAGDAYATGWWSGAGDVDGDGRGDVIVGAPLDDDGDGRSYVVFGKADTDPVALADLATDGGGFVIEGDPADWGSGYAVSGAGDVDGDGLGDVVVGTIGGGATAHVVFGKADTDPVALADVSAGEGGFVVTSEDNGYFAFVVAGGADVNGDGLGDIVIAAPFFVTPIPSVGRTYVVYGKADGLPVSADEIIAGEAGFILDGDPIGNMNGNAVDLADVTGDGLADVLVAAAESPLGASPSVGRTHVALGTSTAPY